MTDDRQQAPDGVSLTVPSNPKFLYVIRSVIYPVVLEAGFSKKEARRVVLAVDEACSNIIKFAYENDHSKTISLQVRLEETRLVIAITDSGKKPDIPAIAPRSLDDVRPGGLGTHFMAVVFDSVHYDIVSGPGTVLTLIKEKHAVPS